MPLSKHTHRATLSPLNSGSYEGSGPVGADVYGFSEPANHCDYGEADLWLRPCLPTLRQTMDHPNTHSLSLSLTNTQTHTHNQLSLCKGSLLWLVPAYPMQNDPVFVCLCVCIRADVSCLASHLTTDAVKTQQMSHIVIVKAYNVRHLWANRALQHFLLQATWLCCVVLTVRLLLLCSRLLRH